MVCSNIVIHEKLNTNFGWPNNVHFHKEFMIKFN